MSAVGGALRTRSASLGFLAGIATFGGRWTGGDRCRNILSEPLSEGSRKDDENSLVYLH